MFDSISFLYTKVIVANIFLIHYPSEPEPFQQVNKVTFAYSKCILCHHFVTMYANDIRPQNNQIIQNGMFSHKHDDISNLTMNLCYKCTKFSFLKSKF